MSKISGSVAAIGIDVGGTELKAVLASAVGIIGEPLRWRREGARDHGQVVRDVRGVVESLASRASDAGVGLGGVGLAIPGLVDPATGRGEFSANLGWADFSLGPELEAALELPVHVEHDVYAGALAEFTIGAGQGVGSGAFVPVGTGLAAALQFGGRLWRGSSRFAGEIGHIRLDGIEGKCGCGRWGCAELIASASGLERAYKQFAGQTRAAEAKEIAARAVGGEQAAVKAWEVCVSYLARALAALTMTVDIEVIIVGGGLSESGRQLLDPLVAGVADELEPLRAAPEIRLAAMGQLAGARGAALHVLATAQSGRSKPAAVAPVAGSPSSVLPMFMLAFDHRASTAAELFGCERVAPEQWEILADAKTVIAEAAGLAGRQVGHIGEVSVLVDTECGEAAAQVAQSEGVATALALEVSGQRRLQLLGEKHLHASIDALDSPRWGKVLLRWNPGDPDDLKAANLAALVQARRFCDSFGVELLLELLVPPAGADLDVVGGDATRYRSEVLPVLQPAAVGEITHRFGPPDLWKLEGVASHTSAAAVSEAACSNGHVPPILILGAGAAPEEIVKWFSAGGGVRGYAGFAIGRSIWKSPISGFLDGSLDRNATRDQIAAKFIGFIEDYIVATRVVLVAGYR